MENGALVISLDFELLWGVFDKLNYREKIEYFENTRKLIPSILQLFEKYHVHCTWATVGMLFNNDWDDWNANIPENLPAYENGYLSAYKYGKSIQTKETEKLCFAPDIVKRIQNSDGQEIGTHTYSHYYCLELGQDSLAFKDDLGKSIELASALNINLKSLVFPRNQFNSRYFKVCKGLGIENVRSNPQDWYWENTQKDSLKSKIFRTGDAYIGSKNKSYLLNSSKANKEIPFAQKASRLLRPYTSNRILNNLKLHRIKSEMSYAARNNEIYHLWWHPHNFGDNPHENLNDLELLLKHYTKCYKDYNYHSLNMDEVKRKL